MNFALQAVYKIPRIFKKNLVNFKTASSSRAYLIYNIKYPVAKNTLLTASLDVDHIVTYKTYNIYTQNYL